MKLPKWVANFLPEYETSYLSMKLPTLPEYETSYLGGNLFYETPTYDVWSMMNHVDGIG
jgi:hypothetical protein